MPQRHIVMRMRSSIQDGSSSNSRARACTTSALDEKRDLPIFNYSTSCGSINLFTQLTSGHNSQSQIPEEFNNFDNNSMKPTEKNALLPYNKQLYQQVDIPFQMDSFRSYHVRKEVLFIVSAIIVFLTSGGLVLGFGPVYSMLLEENQWSELCVGTNATRDPCPKQEIRLQYVFQSSFLSLSIGNAVFGVLLDVIGPRMTNVIGLCLSIIGNLIFARGDSLVGTGYCITIGYSLMAAGGMGSYLSALKILQMFENQGLLCSILSSLFNCSGYIYMLIQIPGITRYVFFHIYAFIVFLCMVLGYCFFPTQHTTTGQVSINSIAIPMFHFEMPQLTKPQGIIAGMKQELQRRDLIYFSFYFGWLSMIFALAGGAIPSLLNKLHPSNGSNALLPISQSVYVNVFYPLLVNGTFIYSPGVGYLIDNNGFKIVFACGIALTQLLLIGMLTPSLEAQIFTFIFDAMAQACVYTLQFAYIIICFPPELYGTLQAFLGFVSFLFTSINYLLSPLVQIYFNGDYTFIIIMVIIPTLPLYIFMDVIDSCEDQVIERKREEEENLAQAIGLNVS